MHKIVKIILPDGSKQRIMAGRLKQFVLHGPKNSFTAYKIWIKQVERTTHSPLLQKQPVLISIIVPCYNTPERYITALVESVRRQTYANWELCLADGSTSAKENNVIKAQSALDKRIKYVKVSENQGISGNTNAGLRVATGSFVAFLDHDDILPEWSINEVATAIINNPKGDVFYSDEDRLTENGKRRMSPLFKPDWSLDFFLSANYVTHLFIIRHKLLKTLGGLRAEYDGSQDYDLMLRALDHNPQVVHIPKILYHMRMAENSTAKSISVKEYVHSTGNHALADYFARQGILADVLQIPHRPTNHRIHYRLVGKPLVSIIIPFKDKPELLKTVVSSILKITRYDSYEIILVSNNSKEDTTYRYLDSLKGNKKIKQYRYDEPFNYSAVNNFGRKKAKGDILIFLNNDTKVLNAEWLEELASVAQRPNTGAVGALLLYPDKTIQHAGVVIGLTGMAGHVFRDLKPGTLTPLWLPDWPRNYLAVTGACLAVEASKFDTVGGFNEEFIICGSDVTICLDLYKKGYSNVYWPYAQLIHYESKSVGSYKNIPPTDYDNSLIHYEPFLSNGDPYFNPNLDLRSEIPTLKKRKNHVN